MSKKEPLTFDDVRKKVDDFTDLINSIENIESKKKQLWKEIYENAFIDRIAFGNGATSVDTAGKILYKTPKVNEAYENSAGLYSRTFAKRLNPSTTDTSISTVVGSSHTDIKVTCTLGYNEPSDADLFDTATNNEGNYVFDELGIFTYPTDGSSIDTSTMLTHVIFHPVQKSLNRVIEIVYTIRVQLQ